MITAIDTNVILDVVTDDAAHVVSSLAMLQQAHDQGHLIISDVVYAELAPQFDSVGELDAVLKDLGADFLVGAHAEICANRLLTRDRGFYRNYFRDLLLLQP